MNKKYYNFTPGDAGITKRDYTDKNGNFIPAGSSVTILTFIEKSHFSHYDDCDVNSANEAYIKFIRAAMGDGTQVDILMSNFSKTRKTRVAKVS